MELKISPNYNGQKVASGILADCVDVYEDRVKGWFLKPARTLLTMPESGFAVLSLALSYFEAHAIYRSGTDSKGNSKKSFKMVFNEVFCNSQPAPGYEYVQNTPEVLDQLADIMYEDGRCALYHGGMPGKRVLVGTASAPITSSVNVQSGRISVVVIDVNKFLLDIEAHLNRYLSELRDPTHKELRDNFMRAWKLKNSNEPLPMPLGPIP